MENLKVSKEAAGKEWLDFLESNDAKALLPDEDLKHGDKDEKALYREQKANYEKIISAISRGFVIIKDDIITQFLKYPVLDSTGNVLHGGKLTFDQRWTASDRTKLFDGLKTGETQGAMIAQQRLCAKLTGWEMILLGKLDFYDLKITDQIVSVFFM